MREFEGHQENLVYVCNIFNELHDIYLRPQQYNAHEKIVLQEAIDILQRHVYSWKERLNSSNMDFYYAFTLPTNWCPEIREELIRPLFIEANLIQEGDSQGRLIFFTELEPTFRNMQSDRYSLQNIEIRPGKQYVICSLDLQTEIHVNLELVSAQYPPALKMTDNNYVPQLLNQTRFTIPFGLEEVRSSLIACLEKRCSTFSAPEVVDMMFEELDKSGEYLQQLAVSLVFTYACHVCKPFVGS
ncbi:uncharacterized protein EV154DRAFT_296322 [Mucor mucedo]|uniref:uncharacterized protein n=1 Tax=Mucor mucedo TaxID=29922 RepID=UPI00221FF7DA|nr:uncharacterized protein EV154DRAFT_296322 [Mucor mucedo]KAI7895811.1 hypothetical protein EV154DRAFT_296322 [Mucor mucedo]